MTTNYGSKLFTINGRIDELVEDGRSERFIINVISRAFDRPKEKARKKVRRHLRRLEKRGFIVLV